MRHSWRVFWLAGLLELIFVAHGHAQTNLQLWGNVTLDWVKSDRLMYELDFEPKVLLAAPEGEPGWRNLDLTPNVESSPNRHPAEAAVLKCGDEQQSCLQIRRRTKPHDQEERQRRQ